MYCVPKSLSKVFDMDKLSKRLNSRNPLEGGTNESSSMADTTSACHGVDTWSSKKASTFGDQVMRDDGNDHDDVVVWARDVIEQQQSMFKYQLKEFHALLERQKSLVLSHHSGRQHIVATVSGEDCE